MQKNIKTALISVYNKDNLEPIIKKLNELGINIISTGGTYNFIKSLNIPVNKVEDISGYPDLFGGRVKTLHPTIMGGILHRRDNNSDINQAKEHNIHPIDLIIVDLYPFEETLKQTTEEADIIEKIDIGGISLIRAGAKNFKDVLVVPSQSHYAKLLELLEKGNGVTNIEERRLFATYAFEISSHYDTCIFNYFNLKENIVSFKESYNKKTTLRYGENPHQKGFYFGNLNEIFTQLHGKEISYNNLQDIEGAIELINEFNDASFVIVKHANACGVAIRDNVTDAWEAALSSDPVSAFGGIIVTNRMIDIKTAEKINEVFFEVLISPDFSPEALEVLKSKKNRILLKISKFDFGKYTFKKCLNGILLQERDNIEMDYSKWKVVTKRDVPKEIIPTLIFANKIVKHTKSNAIVIAGDKKLYGSGMGQTSRVDAVKLAINKAKFFKHNLKDSVLASDAFFPFADGIEEAYNEGIEYIIQPGGSIRDQEVIDFCNNNNIGMVFTSNRHFKH